MSITIQPCPSHDLTPEDERDLAALLDGCFPDTFDGRSYFKQLPHARLLARDEDGRLLGQVGLDHRVIRVGDHVVPILGLIDLCVDANARNQGIGFRLLTETENFGRRAPAPIEFLLLVTDIPTYYEAHGYHRIRPAKTRWLAIEDRRSHSVMQHIEHELVAKPLTDRHWPDGSIDLLGYLF